MSLTTRAIVKVVVAFAAATLLAGCQSGGGDGYGAAYDPDVKPPKPVDQMTREEQIERIDKLPVPDAEKQKMIQDLDKK